MSGRGRGRGRGAVPPSVASAPFNFGNSTGPTSTNGIYSSRTEPSKMFPEILIPEAPKIETFTDLELKSAEYSDKLDSILRMSASFRPIKTNQTKIDRYSDKYLSHVINSNDRRERLSSIQSSLEFFPDELHSVYAQSGHETGNKKKKLNTNSSVSFKETISHLETLAQNEEPSNGEEAKDEDEDDEEAANDVEDEEFEDETDYNYSYFDNGEDNNDYDDGNDEAVF